MRFGAAWWLSIALIGCGGGGDVDAGADAPSDAPHRIDAPTPIDAGSPPSGCGRDGGLALMGDAGMLADVLEPGAFPPAVGPGLGAVTFAESELLSLCGTMDFGDTDERHHNTGFFLDGYLVRPWAHERGRGGVAVLDMSDPCSPVIVANVLDEQIRETHATGYAALLSGRFIAVASITGIQIWDVSDILAPRRVTDFTLPGVTYPDAYMRTVMSIAWQAPYLYVGASDNGVFVVDASDPTAPSLVMQLEPEPSFRVGNVHAVGNLLVVMGSENARVALYDISLPEAPRPFPGGSFLVAASFDSFGRPRISFNYFGMFSGGLSFHARNGTGSGLAIYDLHDPTAPTFVSAIDAPSSAGGYVFLHEGIAFVGLSNYGLLYDVRDPTAPRDVGRIDFPGDLDTITPFGNVVMASVDDDAVGSATGMFPWRAAPDTRGPEVSWVSPADGAERQSLAARIGLTFDEFVAMESVWEGSLEVRRMPSGERVAGVYSGQDGQVSFFPTEPLAPSTTYEVSVPIGGVEDVSGNPVTTAFRSTFTTAACE